MRIIISAVMILAGCGFFLGPFYEERDKVAEEERKERERTVEAKKKFNCEICQFQSCYEESLSSLEEPDENDLEAYCSERAEYMCKISTECYRRSNEQ